MISLFIYHGVRLRDAEHSLILVYLQGRLAVTTTLDCVWPLLIKTLSTKGYQSTMASFVHSPVSGQSSLLSVSINLVLSLHLPMEIMQCVLPYDWLLSLDPVL